MSRIRVLLSAMPRMVREILESAVRAEPDLELVQEKKTVDLERAIEEGHPDVVLFVSDGSGAGHGPGSSLARALVLVGSGADARQIELAEVAAVDASPRELLAAVRRDVIRLRHGSRGAKRT